MKNEENITCIIVISGYFFEKIRELLFYGVVRSWDRQEEKKETRKKIHSEMVSLFVAVVAHSMARSNF